MATAGQQPPTAGSVGEEQVLQVKLQGLYINPNNFSAVPPGAMLQADNVVLNRDDILESRRGQAVYGAGTVLSDVPDTFFSYRQTLLAHTADGVMWYDSDSNGTMLTYAGTYNPPSNAIRIKAVEANKNFYFTSSTGIQKLASVTGTITTAGAPAALGGTGTTTGTSGFFLSGTNVAYQIVWGYTDANSNLVLGAPSQFIIVSNTQTNVTGTTVSGSTSVTALSSLSGLSVNQLVAGAGITTGTTVASFQTSTNINTSIAAASGSVLTFSAVTGVVAGMPVTDTTTGGVIPANTVVVSFTGTTVTLSNAVTAGGVLSGDTINFGNLVVLSQVATASNTGVSLSFGFNTNVSLSFVIPQGIATNWIYQVYRSQMSPNITSSPGVDFAQVFQGNPTSGQLSAKTTTITDVTPEDLKGAFLYTDPNQLGAAAAQYQPPLANDMCVYQGYTFYSNTVSKNDLFLTLTGAGNGTALSYVSITGTINNSTTITVLSATTNLRVGMRVVGTNIPTNATIVSINTGASTMVISAATTGGSHSAVALECQDNIAVGGITYWAGSTSTSNQFQVSTNSDPAIAITQTSYNLIQTVNTFASSTVYGFYESGFTDLPGQLLFQEVGIGGAAFSATSTNGSSFSPNLPTSGTSILSNNNAQQNYLWYSAFSQPEAVPLAQFFPVGSADYPIRRIIALRQSVIILKDDGIYRLYGTTGGASGNFQVLLQDSTTILNAPETSNNFNNQDYFDSLQGVVSLADNGTPAIISRPIEIELNEISVFDNFVENTFAVSYESDRTYMLCTVTAETDTYSTQQFVYNYITQSWTRYNLPRSCGIVLNSDNKSVLYMGNPITKQIMQERKNYNSTDYADEQYAVNITGFSGFNVNMTSTANVVVGMTLGQSGRQSVVFSVNSSTQITVDSLAAWVNGQAFVYTPILNQVQWVPFDCGNPGITKMIPECTFLFRDAAFEQALVGFSTNFSSSPEFVNIAPVAQGDWGSFAWGSQPWGGQLGGLQAIRTYVPQDLTRGNWLQIQLSSQQAFTSFSLQGISMPFFPVSTRFR